MFNIKLVKGNPATALEGPDKLLLSENTAKKYFGNEDALGKRLVYRDGNYTANYEVTGVFKEFPTNSHLIINHLASYASLGKLNKFYKAKNDSTKKQRETKEHI